MPSVADVCILGGGPAGSILAARLAGLGHGVCLVERAAVPRRGLGESLGPGVAPLLASIGADGAIASAGSIPVRSVSVCWDRGEHTRDDPATRGLLVDRRAFDRLLLDHARAAGVRVCQPGRLVGRTPRDDGWDLRIEAGGRMTRLRAAFLADATGRAAVLRTRRRATGCRTLALHASWHGPGLPSRPRIEAGDAEWFWGVPLPDGLYNTLVFIDAARFRAERSSLLGAGFRALLARSRLLPDGHGAVMVGRVAVADATPFLDDECVTPRSIKVGDAALALDPLSSSGVQRAIQTSFAGAIVVNTLLREPGSRDAAIGFYRDRLRETSDHHRAWTAAHYATVAATRPGPFWTARAGGHDDRPARLPPREPSATHVPDDCPLVLSPEARIVARPCLDAEFVRVRPAVDHPSLDGPVAFLGGRELAPLLQGIQPGMTAAALAFHWSSTLPPTSARDIARWLVARGILVPQSSGPGSPARRRPAPC